MSRSKTYWNTNGISWDRMMGLHPVAHMLTGTYRHDGKIDRLSLLQQVTAGLPPTGEWAISTGSFSGEDIVQVAFEKAYDAERIGEIVNAVSVATYAPWRSRRVFAFSPEMVDRLRKAIAPG